MAWYSGTGRENHKSLWDEPVKDRCIFCGSIEEVKCQMTIVFSEFETQIRKERQMSGIQANKHKFKGRGITIDEMQVRMLKAKGMGATAIAKEMGIDRTSVYRVLKR